MTFSSIWISIDPSLPLSAPPPKSPESVKSQTLPDTQNLMSHVALSPPNFSPPPETNAALMCRFLDACGTTPALTAPASPSNPTTPSPAIPPLMTNISTPSFDVPPTRQPSPPANAPPVIAPPMSTTTTTSSNAVPPTRQPLRPAHTHPRAADFFDRPPPTLEDLSEPGTSSTSPLRPPPCPTPSDPDDPIIEDHTTASFPTAQTTTSLHNFRQRYNLEVKRWTSLTLNS